MGWRFSYEPNGRSTTTQAAGGFRDGAAVADHHFDRDTDGARLP